MSTLRDRMASAVRSRRAEQDGMADTRRWAPRGSSSIPGTIVFQGMADGIACVMADRSSTGAALRILGKNPATVIGGLPNSFSLIVGNDRTIFECERMWSEGSIVGVRFLSRAHHTPKPIAKLPKAGDKRLKLAFWKR